MGDRGSKKDSKMMVTVEEEEERTMIGLIIGQWAWLYYHMNF